MKLAPIVLAVTTLLAVSAGAQTVSHSVDVGRRDSVAVPFAISHAGHVTVEVEAWETRYSQGIPMRVHLKLVSTGWPYPRARTSTFVSCGAGSSEASAKSLSRPAVAPKEAHSLCASMGATITKQDVTSARKWSLVISNMGASASDMVHANITIKQTPSEQ